jgi:hypothetical protein
MAARRGHALLVLLACSFSGHSSNSLNITPLVENLARRGFARNSKQYPAIQLGNSGEPWLGLARQNPRPLFSSNNPAIGEEE